MQLYSLRNELLTMNEFINIYEPMYFLTSQNKLIRNKTSPFVEMEIEKILLRGLTPSDLPLILAWKLGTIDHKASVNKIVYRNDCNKTLEYATQYNTIKASNMIKYIDDNFSCLNKLAKTNPYELFTILCENRAKYFGTTYVLTILFFITNGIMPIYDKYAYIALLAIKNDIKPQQTVNWYKSIPQLSGRSSWETAWSTYLDYCKLLLEVAGQDEYKNRAVDRSLWVYGHAFILAAG